MKHILFAGGIFLLIDCPGRAAVLATVLSDPMVIANNIANTKSTYDLPFPGDGAPVLQIQVRHVGSSLSLLNSIYSIRFDLGGEQNYGLFRTLAIAELGKAIGSLAALAPGSVIGRSSFEIGEIALVDAWGASEWVTPEVRLAGINTISWSDDNRYGEHWLQNLPEFQGPEQQGGRQYAGFAWEREDGYHYGWVRILSATPYEVVIDAWAWETEPDTPIIAGVIPEPSVPILASLAFLGAAARRRKSPAS